MNLESLTTSLLFSNAMLFIGIGIIIGAAVVVIVNNLFHRYWKPIAFFSTNLH